MKRFNHTYIETGDSKYYFSEVGDPDSFKPTGKVIRFPFNTEPFIRWCHKRGWLTWILVSPNTPWASPKKEG